MKKTTKNNTITETPTPSAGEHADLFDSFYQLEYASRRQLETLYKLKADNKGVTLEAVLSGDPSEKTLLICSNSIAINYDGLINYNGAGFCPIDWTPLGEVM
jgi:hypothetical protein